MSIVSGQHKHRLLVRLRDGLVQASARGWHSGLDASADRVPTSPRFFRRTSMSRIVFSCGRLAEHTQFCSRWKRPSRQWAVAPRETQPCQMLYTQGFSRAFFATMQVEADAQRNSIRRSTTNVACCSSLMPFAWKKGFCRCSARVRLLIAARTTVGRNGMKARGNNMTTCRRCQTHSGRVSFW